MNVTEANSQYPSQAQYNYSYGSASSAPANNGYLNPANNPLYNQVNGIQPQAQPLQAHTLPSQPNTEPVSNPQPCYYQPQINVPPNANGVNIQIFNPSVATPGSQAHSNVNAPNYYCYPPNYYTSQLGNGGSAGGAGGTDGTGTGNKVGSGNGVNGSDNGSSTNTTNTTTQTSSTGSNKTEKKRIVVLNDNYIKNLEDMLNSHDKSDRVTAAKQVFERLDEDSSRKDDKALTALINKMLQDPSQEVRLLALSALEGRICNGDQLTVQLLQQMRANPKDYGYDANDASRILLDMSAQKADKEVPVDPDKQTVVKKEEKKEEKNQSQIKSSNQNNKV